VQRAGQDSFNWTSLDAMYKYCADNNIIFKQHTFVWGSQQPSWTSSLTADTAPAAVQTWMTSFCQRYPAVRIIDVVNEPPPHTTPAYADAIGGGSNTTWDWIVNAFSWARQACPNAILVLNDFSNAEDAGTAQHNIDIVNTIKAAGAPIDAVGCQLHDAVFSSSGTLKANIDLIARATGLPVYITEYDIDTADDAEQERVMRDEITMFWNNDNIKGITLWGYVVGHTWRSNTGLIQDDGTPRPAMTWLMGFLGR
jgi:endo-1,4-beta-xylanase